MQEIKLLEESVISRIAAGEVIERPASVLKELLENSADSGATAINVDMERAGKQLIRVNDNGSGIPPGELGLAMVRHATSKIKRFEDLDTLSTFGFRGEALFSIGAVSRFSLSSFPGGPGIGRKIMVEGGKVVGETDALPVPGTTVEVRDLFFNTPARLKFLKSDVTERSHMLRVVEECALANLGISFRVRTDGAEVYRLPVSQKDFGTAVMDRTRLILGKEAAQNLLFAEDMRLGMKVFFSRREYTPATRGMQFFFVDRRPVSCKVLQQAVYAAYKKFRTEGRHPACILYMEMPPSDFDVNIHPQKKEVRFKNENEIFKIVSSVIEQGLDRSAGPVSVSVPAPDSVSEAPSAYTVPVGQPHVSPEPLILPSSALKAPLLQPRPAPRAAVSQKDKAAALWKTSNYRYIGQLSSSYLLFEQEGNLILVDQHAAQEIIFFEKYMAQLAAASPAVQRLMLPIEIEMPASAVDRLMEWQSWLGASGFELERFSPSSVSVHSAPSLFGYTEQDIRELFASLSEVLGDPAKCSEEVKRDTLASLACKKAVKANERLSGPEAERLLADLKEAEAGLACPHGRPTIVSVDRKELAKWFQRGKPV